MQQRKTNASSVAIKTVERKRPALRKASSRTPAPMKPIAPPTAITRMSSVVKSISDRFHVTPSGSEGPGGAVGAMSCLPPSGPLALARGDSRASSDFLHSPHAQFRHQTDETPALFVGVLVRVPKRLQVFVILVGRYCETIFRLVR